MKTTKINVNAILEPIIKSLKNSKTKTKKELQQQAIALLLVKVAENEIDTVLEISAKAFEELGWSEMGEEFKQKARQIRVLYF